MLDNHDKDVHWKVEDILTNPNCPECQKNIEQIGKGYMKEFLLNRKDLELECEECNTPVREEEEECPTCGSSNARSKGY